MSRKMGRCSCYYGCPLLNRGQLNDIAGPRSILRYGWTAYLNRYYWMKIRKVRCRTFQSARFLTFAQTIREQSPRIPLGPGNNDTDGESVTAQEAQAHQGRIPPE